MLDLESLVTQSKEKRTSNIPRVWTVMPEHLFGLLTIDCSPRCSVTASVTLLIFQSQHVLVKNTQLWQRDSEGHSTVVLAKIKLMVSLGDFGEGTHDLIARWDGVDMRQEGREQDTTIEGMWHSNWGQDKLGRTTMAEDSASSRPWASWRTHRCRDSSWTDHKWSTCGGGDPKQLE